MFAISKSKGNKKLYHAFLADVEVMQNVEQRDALFCQIFGHTPEEGSREQVNHIRFKEAIANYNKDEGSKEYDFFSFNNLVDNYVQKCMGFTTQIRGFFTKVSRKTFLYISS